MFFLQNQFIIAFFLVVSCLCVFTQMIFLILTNGLNIIEDVL